MNNREPETGPFIERTLWYEDEHGRRLNLRQSELLIRAEPLVILGEPGMGKTELLKQLGSSPECAYCTARQLITRHDPKTLLGDAKTLLIDALDEVDSAGVGEAVERVLSTLGKLNYPHFIMACRVADWRNAAAREAVHEQYPLVLHLVPFSDDDASMFLSRQLRGSDGKLVIEHFKSRGLSDLLGNPQTLIFITEVAKDGALPETRGELFERAVGILCVEHRKDNIQTPLSADDGWDAAGAAFAGLILTGMEVIVRTSLPNRDDGEMGLSESLDQCRSTA